MPVTYFSLLSLKRIAEIRVAVSLWNNGEVKNLLSEYAFYNPNYIVNSEWEKVEEKAVEKVQSLPLPASLKEEVSFIIKPIGLRILAFYSSNRWCFSAINVPKEFYWTSHGTIDAKKNAEILVRNENLSARERYKVACTYCLEDYIYILWEQLNDSYKDLEYIRAHEYPLVSFWSHHIKGRLAELNSMMRFCYSAGNDRPYEYAFYLSAVSYNEVATRYFTKKLNSEYKNRILITAITNIVSEHYDILCEGIEHGDKVLLLKFNLVDVLCFLLSFLNEEQQVEIFKDYLLSVLNHLLEWPWQGFFAKTVQYACAFRENYNHPHNHSTIVCMYYSLLVGIVHKINLNYQDYRYENLFQVFWEQIPNSHKRCIINKCIYDPFVLSSLFTFDNKDNIRLMLHDATVAEKMDMVFHVGKVICKLLVLRNNWDFLKFFIEQCITSKEVMIRFKEELEEYMTCRLTSVSKEWSELFHLLDSLIHGYDKRKGIEDNSSEKIC